MRLHYVEDDHADVVAMRHVLRDRKDVTLNTSERLEQIGGQVEFESLDAILIDVFRPDAVSIESDLNVIRAYTEAPVMFLTGTDPSTIRERALLAGAQAVISKNALNADLLTQFLENAKVSANLLAKATQPDPDDLAIALSRSAAWPMRHPTVTSVGAAIAYVERELSYINLAASGGRDWARNLPTVIALTRLLKLVGDRAFDLTVACDAAQALAGLAELLEDEAGELGVAFQVECAETPVWWALGSKAHARGGLEALLRACLAACSRGDWLHIWVGGVDGQVQIDISGDQPRIGGLGESLLNRDEPTNAATAFFQCAAHLLGLRPEQIEASKRPRPKLRIYL